MAIVNAGNAGKLMGMDDDTFGMVLAAINQPQAAAACMLATCQRVGAELREAVPEAALAPSMGQGSPMIVQAVCPNTHTGIFYS